MRSLFPILVITAFFALLYVGARWGFRAAYPRAWGWRPVQRAVNAVPFVWGGGLLAGVAARFAGMNGLAQAGFFVSVAVVILLLSTLGPLLVAGLVRRWADGRASAPAKVLGEEGAERPSPETPVASTRRELLVRTSAALPATGLVVAGAGGIQGLAGAQLQQLEMSFPGLPSDLEGFRVLHYTDMHLGSMIDLLEVERLVELGRQAHADLVVLTGDMSDDLGRLLPALRRFESLDPPHGVIASIGNHEYFRGIKPTLQAYAKTRVEMLIEKGLTLRVGGTDLYVGGADDPRVLRGDKMAFMRRTVNEALDGAPSEAFRLLLSHRPDGFVPAAKAGFNLTLSGHTHGAQLGFDGRSWFENFMPDRYLWGAYAAGDRRLYTSSGAGHWFPFRVGCPREVPLIVLRRGPAGGEVKKTRLA